MAIAGTLDIDSRPAGSDSNPCELHTLHWTSDASGNVSGRTISIRGLLANVAFQPDVSAAPSDNYDVQLLDSSGFDVLSGQGSNLDQTDPKRIVPALPMTDGTTVTAGPVFLLDNLEVVVTNAGDSKKGYIRLYIKRP